jgi:hypothetical protein
VYTCDDCGGAHCATASGFDLWHPGCLDGAKGSAPGFWDLRVAIETGSLKKTGGVAKIECLRVRNRGKNAELENGEAEFRNEIAVF